MSNRIGYNSIPRTNLVWEWLLDGNALDTAWTNNWTATNVTYTNASKGYVSEVGVFNGTSAYVTAWITAPWTNAFSFSCWMKTTTTSARVIASSAQVVSDKYFSLINNADWTISFRLTDVTATNATSAGTFNDWKRHFIVWTRIGATMKLYIDSVLQDTQTKSATISWTTLYIWNFSSLIAVYFNWEQWLDRLYNVALTQEQISNLYLEWQRKLATKASYPALLNWTVAYYDFKWDANDIIGGNNWTVTGATLTTDHLGRSNSAYSFSWTNQYITIANSFIHAWSFIMKARVKIWLLNSTSQIIFTKWSDYNTQTNWWQWWTLRISATNKIETSCVTTVPSIVWNVVTSPDTISVWTWYDIMSVYDNTAQTFKLYVDWVLKWTVATWNTIRNNTNNIESTIWCIRWADWTYSSPFTWDIAYAIYWETTKTVWEVLTLYQLTQKDYIYPFTRESTLNLQDGLVMHLDWAWNDLSGNGNNGTLTWWPVKIRKNQSEWLKYTATSNQYIATTLLATSNFTFDVTVNAYSNPENWAILAKYDWSAKIFQLYLYSVTGKFYLDFWQVGWTRVALTWWPVVSFNTQYRITVTYDWTTSKMYINWVLEASSTTVPSDWIDAIPFDISSRNSDWRTIRNWNWEIFEPRYWNRALSAKEVEQWKYLSYLPN